MVHVEGSHTSENIKKYIESGINIFQFDKSKIRGIYFSFFIKLTFLSSYLEKFSSAVVCDQGSNFVRLFSQIKEGENGKKICIGFCVDF
jgi:hypothetical protein